MPEDSLWWKWTVGLFDPDGFVRRGGCPGWTTDLVYTTNTADLMIWLAYMIIPVFLIYIVRKRRDIPFNFVFWMFAAFILGCGLTHLSGACMTLLPLWRLDAVIKLATGVVSWATIYALYRLIPDALAMRTPQQLETVNKALTDTNNRLVVSEESLLTTKGALERSNEELQRFAYLASHDLQEPLRMVANFCKLLEKQYKGKLDAKADQYIHYAVDGALRMQALIQDLLSISKVNSHPPSMEKFDANKSYNIAIANLSVGITEAEADITCEPLPVIVGDANQLTTVFQNLLGNAIKFHKKGERPVVRVSARENEQSWEFSISDNGVGIPPAQQGQLFKIFKRLHAKEYPGTGIGLAICKTIVERHGGEIWINSSGGGGTTFLFTIRKPK